ncbi:hypothetical protein PIB30_036440 [Stylosanthes scabra]|uniref:Uncharacterized protein n=1 Tax=Stylosanthes scabra TaxID=79078 RepID=A0ABU6UD81_9FABA|nr:hypothetical protein [Stylosanthes scabra]
MAGGDVTLNRLRNLTRPSASVGAAVPVTPMVGHAGAGPSLTTRVITPPGPTPEVIITPEQGSSNDGVRGVGRVMRSPLQSETMSSRFLRRLPIGFRRQWDPWLLRGRGQRVRLWAMLKSATIMRSVEPRLTMMDEAERHNQRLVGDLKALNLQKVVLEEQLKDAAAAKEKLTGDLKSVEKNLEVLRRKKNEEVAIVQGRVKELESEVQKLRDSVAAEMARADLAEEKIPGLEKQRNENAEDAKAAVAATEGVLKAQLAVLISEFDTSHISFFKKAVDGKVVDLHMDPLPS